MQLNKGQKVATVIFCVLLTVLLLFLTPYVARDLRGEQEYSHWEAFGNFFMIRSEEPVEYPKLYGELGLLTIIYLLALLVLKSKVSK